MRKRLLAMMLILMMAALAAGCGSSGSAPAAEPEGSAAEEATENNNAGQTAEPEYPITNGIVPDNTKLCDGTIEVRKGGMLFGAPDYYGILPEQTWEEVLNADVTSLFAARGENLCMVEFFAIDNTGAILEEHFIEYHDQLLEKKITSIEGSEHVTDFKREGYTVFHIDNGQVAAVGSYSFNMSGIEVEAKTVMINAPDTPALVYVSLFQAADAEYDYTVDFEKMIMGAKFE